MQYDWRHNRAWCGPEHDTVVILAAESILAYGRNAAVVHADPVDSRRHLDGLVFVGTVCSPMDEDTARWQIQASLNDMIPVRELVRIRRYRPDLHIQWDRIVPG